MLRIWYFRNNSLPPGLGRFQVSLVYSPWQNQDPSRPKSDQKKKEETTDEKSGNGIGIGKSQRQFWSTWIVRFLLKFGGTLAVGEWPWLYSLVPTTSRSFSFGGVYYERRRASRCGGLKFLLMSSTKDYGRYVWPIQEGGSRSFLACSLLPRALRTLARVMCSMGCCRVMISCGRS